MAIPQEISIGVATESTYKTYVAPTVFFEPTAESLDWKKTVVQGEGLRVGKIGDYADRRAVVAGQGDGDLTIECISKGMGKLLKAALGAGTSTVISSPAYMQNFVPGNSPGSLTLQKGTPEAGGTPDYLSFMGAMVTDWEFAIPNLGLSTFKPTFDFGDYSTAQSGASVAYPTSASLFHFGNATWTTGTYTAGTTTTLATCATSTADIRSLTVSGKNNMTVDRFNGGSGGRKAIPLMGKREFTGTVEIEYDATTYRDAYLGDTTISLIGKMTAGVVGASTETLQINLPAIKLDAGIPMSNGSDLIVVSHDFTILDDRTNPMVQFQYLTADTTI